MNLGEKITAYLQEKQITQRELAEMVGVTEVSISRYISGDRVPKGPILANIAKIMDVTVEQLLDEQEEVRYTLTPGAILHMTLDDFGISTPVKPVVMQHVAEEFLSRLCKFGYAVKREE